MTKSFLSLLGLSGVLGFFGFLGCTAKAPSSGPEDAGVRFDAPAHDAELIVPADASAGDAVATDDADDSADAVPDAAPMVHLSPEELAIAGQLEGAFLEVDCASAEIEFQFCHPKDMGIDNLSFTFGGEAGKAYSVVLNVYGVMETIFYKGGTKTPIGSGFYIGGDSGTPGTAEYGLRVGDQTYFLNYQEIGAGEHYTYSIEYTTPPITIMGGTTVVLFVHDPDNFMNTNHMQNDIPDAPPGLQAKLAVIHAQTLQGQFVYLAVASAQAVP